MSKKDAKNELVKQKNILEQLTITDDLTRLYNHRHLNTVLTHEFERCTRYHTDLPCLMFDLDHFKQVNDTYGHGFGDTVLREFAQRVKDAIRSTDFAFRFGGEEFMILLPQTTIAGGTEVAAKFCQHNATKEFIDLN